MIKLTEIILEQTGRPKAIIMAGGAGAGKSYLLGQLSLQSLPQFNPDKYVEDPDHPFHNNLGAASRQVDKDVEAAADAKGSFVWDTTASGKKFDQNLDKLLDKGYDLDKGAILLKDEDIFHGADAINTICKQINNPSSSLLLLLSKVFKSNNRTNTIFPLLVRARRFALISKGISTSIV